MCYFTFLLRAYYVFVLKYTEIDGMRSIYIEDLTEIRLKLIILYEFIYFGLNLWLIQHFLIVDIKKVIKVTSIVQITLYFYLLINLCRFCIGVYIVRYTIFS